jgi:hypothetical protein
MNLYEIAENIDWKTKDCKNVVLSVLKGPYRRSIGKGGDGKEVFESLIKFLDLYPEEDENWKKLLLERARLIGERKRKKKQAFKAAGKKLWQDGSSSFRSRLTGRNKQRGQKLGCDDCPEDEEVMELMDQYKFEEDRKPGDNEVDSDKLFRKLGFKEGEDDEINDPEQEGDNGGEDLEEENGDLESNVGLVHESENLSYFVLKDGHKVFTSDIENIQNDVHLKQAFMEEGDDDSVLFDRLKEFLIGMRVSVPRNIKSLPTLMKRFYSSQQLIIDKYK